jgi:hypothetical protein
MPTAAAAETVLRSQPKAVSHGTMSTPGAERTPAAVSSATKMTPATTKA